MTAKEFLYRVQTAERELRIIQDKKRHYNDLICSIGANMGKAVIQKPSGASKTETAAVGLVFLNEKLLEKEKEYTALVLKAEKLIGKISQDKFREVLSRRYLCGESWKTIRDKMDYRDEKSVFRCHGYALKELQKIMGGNYVLEESKKDPGS